MRASPGGLSSEAPADNPEEFLDPTGDVAGFARQLGLTFTIWHDPSGQIQRTYRTTGVPESFIIDRNGVIQKKVIGATEWDSGSHPELIRRLLES